MRSSVLAMLAGLAAGAACLVRPSAYLAIAAVLALVLTSERRNAARANALFLLAFVVPLAAWGTRNYAAFGVLHWQPTNVGQELFRRSAALGAAAGVSEDDPDAEQMRTLQDEFALDRWGRRLAARRLLSVLARPPLPTLRDGVLLNQLRFWEHDLDILRWCSISSYASTLREDAPKPLAAASYTALATAVMAAYVTVLLLASIGALRWMCVADNAGTLMLMLYVLMGAGLACVFTAQPRLHYELMPALCLLSAGSNGLFARRAAHPAVSRG